MADRNSSRIFAERTLANLNSHYPHAIVQLTNSLLGLVVFPWEKRFKERLKGLRPHDLGESEWPHFKRLSGTWSTLDELLRHLRNALAHSRISFSSDSSDPSEVNVRFEDFQDFKWKENKKPDWAVEINAANLKNFCRKFVKEALEAVD